MKKEMFQGGQPAPDSQIHIDFKAVEREKAIKEMKMKAAAERYHFIYTPDNKSFSMNAQGEVCYNNIPLKDYEDLDYDKDGKKINNNM